MLAMEEQLNSKVDKNMTSNTEALVENKAREGYDAFSMAVERQIAKELQEIRGMVNKELQKSCANAKDSIVSVEHKRS